MAQISPVDAILIKCFASKINIISPEVLTTLKEDTPGNEYGKWLGTIKAFMFYIKSGGKDDDIFATSLMMTIIYLSDVIVRQHGL